MFGPKEALQIVLKRKERTFHILSTAGFKERKKEKIKEGINKNEGKKGK